MFSKEDFFNLEYKHYEYVLQKNDSIFGRVSTYLTLVTLFVGAFAYLIKDSALLFFYGIARKYPAMPLLFLFVLIIVVMISLLFNIHYLVKSVKGHVSITVESPLELLKMSKEYDDINYNDVAFNEIWIEVKNASKSNFIVIEKKHKFLSKFVTSALFTLLCLLSLFVTETYLGLKYEKSIKYEQYTKSTTDTK